MLDLIKPMVINGSSRKDGNTTLSIEKAFPNLPKHRIKFLLDFDISPYDYKNRNGSDDFIPLVEKILEDSDTIVFATPVYWYTMSGQMKVFLDRFTDLISIRKDLGYQLKSKGLFVLSNSGVESAPNGFYKPFKLSAEYLGMRYLGKQHTVWND